jgi:hypothetical protein
MPAPALRLSGSATQVLELLEDQLHNSYGFLLSILPRSLFETRNNDIVIKQQYLSDHGFEKSPVYGSLSAASGALQLCAESTLEEKVPGHSATKPGARELTPSDFDDCIVAFSQVPPLAWISSSPGWLGTPQWKKRTSALIQYYLLIWAFEEGYPGYVASPHPDHLRDALNQLQRTRYCMQAMVRREEDDFFDIHIARLEDANIRVVQSTLTVHSQTHLPKHVASTQGDSGHDFASVSTAGSSSRDVSMLSSTEVIAGRTTPATDVFEDRPQYLPKNISMRSTSPEHPVQRTASEPLPITTQSVYRQGAYIRSRSSLGFGSPSMVLVIPGLNRTLQARATGVWSYAEVPRLNSLQPQKRKFSDIDPQPVPNIDRSGSSTPAATLQAADEQNADVLVDAQVPVMDQHLTQLQTRVGHDLLSLLPELRTTIFKRLHPRQERPGYLSLRMLFGMANKAAPTHLQNCNVWIVFKIHEKDARTAPRMLLDATSSDDHSLIEENLNFKNTLLWLDLEHVFSIVTEEGLKREHQLKAMVKYYLMLAAEAKLRGFEKHLMPVNDTFVEMMRTVCKRVQNNDLAPKQRKRRRVGAGPNDDAAAPEMHSLTPVPTLPERRSGRAVKRSPNATDAVPERRPGSSGSNTSKPRSSRSSTPAPKIALGAIIQKGAPSHIKNQFLDTSAEPCNSDGESGDEIPAGIPGHTQDILRKRAQAKSMVQGHQHWIKEHRLKKANNSRAAKKLEWLVSHGKAKAEESKSRISFQKKLASQWQGRIEDRQKAVSGFRRKEIEYDELVKGIDRNIARLWDAQQEQAERQGQQGLNGM